MILLQLRIFFECHINMGIFSICFLCGPEGSEGTFHATNSRTTTKKGHIHMINVVNYSKV